MTKPYTNKNRLYKYTLKNPSFGEKVMYSAPGGWEESGFKFARSTKYWGVFRSRSNEVLSFKKEGRRFLIRILQSEGVDGTCEYIEEKYNLETYSYDVQFTGDVDFSTKDINRKSFDVKIIDSTFDAIIRNREDIPVKLFDLTSLNGFDIPGNTHEGVSVELPGKTDLYYNILNVAEGIFETSTLIYAALLKVVTSEDDGIKDVTDDNDTTGTDGAFIIAEKDTTIYIVGHGGYRVGGVTGSGNVNLKLRHYNGAGVLQTEYSVFSHSVVNYTSIDIDYSQDIDLLKDDYVILILEFTGITYITSFTYGIEQSSNTIYRTIPDTQCVGFMRFEALSRIIQSITDTVDPLRSAPLGRTDSEPFSYAEDGDSSLGLTTNGRLIRQFPVENNPLSSSLWDLFQSYSVESYLGLGIDEIDGEKKVVCEHVDYFFDERVILTIDNAKDISSQFARDFIYNSIQSGYQKLAYEKKDGILEYNNKSNWSTYIKSVKNKLNLVSRNRADNAGIHFAKEKAFADFPSEDTQYDDDNFMIDLVRETNLILNSGFDDWTGDVPDDWTVVKGGLKEKQYLGDSRCGVDSVEPDGVLSIAKWSQDVNVSAGDTQTVSMVYKFVSEVPVSGFAWVIVEVGGYRLKPDGSWDNTYTGSLLIGEDSVTEAELQSFSNFNITSDAVPVSGAMSVIINTTTVGFVIDDVFVGGSYMKARTTEGFDSISGTVNDERSYNIRSSPARIIRRWGSIIRAALDKYDGSYIVYNRADKNSNLVSQETGEAEITENANVLVANLNDPRIDPDFITLNAPITNAIISTINDKFASDDKPKKYGIVKVRDELDKTKYHYGWLWEVNSGAKTKEKPMILIKVNTDKLTPVE